MADGLTLDQKKALAMASARQRASESSSGGGSKFEMNAMQRGAAERVLGAGELINNAGIGKHLGLPPNDILEGAVDLSKQAGEKARSAEGFGARALSAVGGIAGDPISYVGGAEAKGARGVVELARAGAKYGIASGLTDYGAKNLSENLSNAGKEGTKAAVAAPALAVGVPAAAKAISKEAAAGGKLLKEGFRARSPEMLANATQNIANEGHASFDAMRASGVALTPEIATKLTGHLQKEVEKMGVLNPQIHGATISILKQMRNESQKGMGVDRLHQYRKLLRGAEKKEVRAGNDEGALAAQNAIAAMDDAVEAVKVKGGSKEGSAAIQSMQNGVKTWAKMRKFDTIADAVERSNGDPDKMKTALKKIYDSPKLSRGFTKEEKAALREASENTTSESLLKMVGKFGFDISKGVQGNRAPFWTGVGAHLMGAPSPALVALTGAGTAARYGQKLAERAKTERLLKLIESGNSAIGAVSPPLSAGRLPAP